MKTLFESMPCGILVVDGDRRIQVLNNTLERTFGITMAEAVDKRGGEALKCIHAFESPEGCGYAPECETCQVRNSALEAIAGRRVHRNKADVQLRVKGTVRDLVLLVSAAPFDYQGQRLATVILEDVTELNRLRRRLTKDKGFTGIVGRDPGIVEILGTIIEAAAVNLPVLIHGESGTGKELVAAAIHNQGPRADKPFVPVNCGALPQGLVESELFGHVKGAFTGAMRDKKGRFELAHCGTLFLDEVAELNKVSQANLLRVLQEGRFERVGDEKTISVDVRLISATNQDLKREVKRGRFREDLYYRINVVPIYMPPLRERKKDIPLLLEHFLDKAQEEGQETSGLSEEALAVMMDYPWPGNIRELQSALRFALIKSKGQIIQPGHLPLELRAHQEQQSKRGPSRKLSPESVRAALAESGGNKAKAARILGVGRATLYRFMAEFPDLY